MTKSLVKVPLERVEKTILLIRGERVIATLSTVNIERIHRHIFVLRGIKVMLSSDLAELYGVEVKVLNQAVKRNSERFPRDFMFQLTRKEFESLKSRIVTSSWGGARRALPYAFSEHGILMLSTVLRSPRAIQVNIAHHARVC